MATTGTKKPPAPAESRRSNLEWQTVSSLYCDLGNLFLADESEAAITTVQQRLLLWKQLSCARVHLVRAAGRFRTRRSHRAKVQLAAARRELELLDVAIAKDGPRALQSFVKRVRNVRLIRALELIQELLGARRAGSALDALDSKAKLAFVRTCLLGVHTLKFNAAFEDPEIQETHARQGPFRAALAVIEALGVLEASSVKKVQARLRREFAMGDRSDVRSPIATMVRIPDWS